MSRCCASGGRFGRAEPRRRDGGFVRGLLAGLPRANCWTIAEHAGELGRGDAAAAVGRGLGRGRAPG